MAAIIISLSFIAVWLLFSFPGFLPGEIRLPVFFLCLSHKPEIFRERNNWRSCVPLSSKMEKIRIESTRHPLVVVWLPSRFDVNCLPPVLEMLLALLALAAGAWDSRTRRIPNVLVGPGLAHGFGVNGLWGAT